MDRKLVMLSVIQTATIIVGVQWGRAVHYPGRSPTMYTFIAMFAMFLLAVEWLVSRVNPRVGENRYPVMLVGGCLAYMMGVLLAEPFLYVHGIAAIAGAAVVLIPLLLAFTYLYRHRAWFAAAGVLLFVLTCTAMMTTNAGVSDAGSGLVVLDFVNKSDQPFSTTAHRANLPPPFAHASGSEKPPPLLLTAN